MRPFSIDLKERIVKAHKRASETTQSELAKRFLIAQSSVSRILGQYHRNESLAPKKKPGRPRKMSQADVLVLEELIKHNTDRTLEEYVFILAEQGIDISDSTVSRELQRLKQTRKKKDPL